MCVCVCAPNSKETQKNQSDPKVSQKWPSGFHPRVTLSDSRVTQIKIDSKNRSGSEQLLSEGPKGGRRKGGRSRKLSHFSFCCASRCCVVYSPCFPVWGEEKVMTIYDAGPLAAGPLCGLLILRHFRSL